MRWPVMPLTNEFTPEESKAHRFHVWLTIGGDPTQGVKSGKISSVCGQVHVLNRKALRPVDRVAEDLPEDTEGVEAFLARNDVCSTCADVAREELGLPLRELEDVPGIGSGKAAAMREVGLTSVSQLRRLSQAELAETPGIGNALAARIKADVGDEEDVVRP